MSIIAYSADLDTQEQPQPLPVNTYPGQIESAEEKDSKDGSSKYLALAIRIPADAYPADYVDGDPDGTLLFFNKTPVADTPKGRWKMRQLRIVCGLTPGGREVDPYEFVGLSVQVAVSNSEWQGEKQAQIDKIVGTT